MGSFLHTKCVTLATAAVTRLFKLINGHSRLSTMPFGFTLYSADMAYRMHVVLNYVIPCNQY